MQKSGKNFKLFSILILLIVVGIGVYIFTSKNFERVKPQIVVNDKLYWNLRNPIKVVLKDNLGIKSYKVTINDGKSKQTLYDKTLDKPLKEVVLAIKAPRVGMLFEQKKAVLNIEVTDSSKWNYFRGNEAKKKVDITIDTQSPNQYVVANSYKIRKGGCALVIFKSTDENLKDVYVQTNFKKRFIPEPFYKKGYYIALIAWPIDKKNFRAYVVSEDKAGNVSKTYIRYYLLDKKYKTSKIHLTDNYLNGKVAFIAENYGKSKLSKIEKFKFVNETLRKKNEDLITKITSKVPQEKINSLRVFHPLKNAAVEARFGEHRYYYYHKKLISESYHLGIDLASYKEAPIIASNGGKVVFAKYNGIYGNMPVIYHGLGLYTLYGHCSSVLVNRGDEVKAGEKIAKTGSTGGALGDHLHFEIVVQGVPVYPREWKDRHWIKVNIKNIIKDAKKMIDMER